VIHVVLIGNLSHFVRSFGFRRVICININFSLYIFQLFLA